MRLLTFTVAIILAVSTRPNPEVGHHDPKKGVGIPSELIASDPNEAELKSLSADFLLMPYTLSQEFYTNTPRGRVTRSAKYNFRMPTFKMPKFPRFMSPGTRIGAPGTRIGATPKKTPKISKKMPRKNSSKKMSKSSKKNLKSLKVKSKPRKRLRNQKQIHKRGQTLRKIRRFCRGRRKTCVKKIVNKKIAKRKNRAKNRRNRKRKTEKNANSSKRENRLDTIIDVADIALDTLDTATQSQSRVEPDLVNTFGEVYDSKALDEELGIESDEDEGEETQDEEEYTDEEYEYDYEDLDYEDYMEDYRDYVDYKTEIASKNPDTTYDAYRELVKLFDKLRELPTYGIA